MSSTNESGNGGSNSNTNANDEMSIAAESTDNQTSIPSTPSRRTLQSSVQSPSSQSQSQSEIVPPTPQSQNRRRSRQPSSLKRSEQHDDDDDDDPFEESKRVESVPSTPASSRRTRRRLNIQNDDNNDDDNDDDANNENDNEEREIIPPTPMSANSQTSHDNNHNDGTTMSISSFTTTGYGSYAGMSRMSTSSYSRRVGTVTGASSIRGSNDNDNISSRNQNIQEQLKMLDSSDEEEDNDNNYNHNNQQGDNQRINNNTQQDTHTDIDTYTTAQDQQQRTVFRGTDINVRSVELAFKDFLQNFISLQESERVIKKKEREKRNQGKRERRRLRNEARAKRSAGGGGGDGGDEDDDDDNHDDNESWDQSFSSIDTTYDDNDENTKTPLYIDKLRNILLGRKHEEQQQQQQVQADDDEIMTSSNVIATNAALDLNTIQLYYHSPECQRLYYQLVSYPGEVIPLMDLIVVREMEALLAQLHDEKNEADESTISEYDTLHPLNIPVPRVQVRPFHLKSLSHMRSLDPQSIDNLLSIRGMVVRTSPIIPDLKVAHFECCICSTAATVTLERGRVSEPTVCPTCNIKNGFELIHNRSLFSDKQMVRIQETPNEVPPGETPASIVLFAYDDLVDAVRPGDRIEITGIFRAQGRRINPKISKVKCVYKTYLDVIHFRKVSGDNQNTATTTANDEDDKEDGEEGEEQHGKGLAVENVGLKLTDERIEQLEKLAKLPDIYDQLVKSLAPSIWELDDVKKGVLCMLFGGNSRRVKKGSDDRRRRLEQDPSNDDENYIADTSKLNKRGDINILLCGDPGTSKSQLLSYVHKLAPRGVYTSGKGSSAVGLTASVVRDPETKDLVLESGALVLSDLGICCIDEFDKMSDTTRAILHEAMEQQTVSIAKAGIIATLNARTSILASANPVESRYNPQMSVVDNIKLPPTLLSRFDLIYLILDAPNVDGDRRLAQHLVGLYYDTPNVVRPPLDQNLLRDYIAYARDNIFPELSDLATRELISAYLEMRKMGAQNGNGSRTISATPRQLESLIRLSEGLAKMRFSRVVERADVKEAVRLMKVATQAAATDPRTGRIDMDMITTGRSTSNREMEEALNLSLKELLAEVSYFYTCN